MLSPIRIDARDRRQSANHEAGHFVVAQWAGARDVGAWIGRRATSDPRLEHTWTGQLTYELRKLRKLSLHRLRMIAAAGGLAEHLWLTREVPDWFSAADWLFDPAVMSASDWGIGGCFDPDNDEEDLRPWERAATQTYELLHGPLRAPWLRAARTLIETGVLFPPRPSPALREAIEKARRVMKKGVTNDRET